MICELTKELINPQTAEHIGDDISTGIRGTGGLQIFQNISGVADVCPINSNKARRFRLGKCQNPSFGRFRSGGFDVLCVHSGCPLFWWLSHLSVSSLAAKGKGATPQGGAQGAETKSFCSLSQKVFGGVHFTPCATTRRCYEQPSA